jgi:hypothetical protein
MPPTTLPAMIPVVFVLSLLLDEESDVDVCDGVSSDEPGVAETLVEVERLADAAVLVGMLVGV